ncbi:MAG: N-acetyltransferase family protein [Inquilinaceae bacterium]
METPARIGRGSRRRGPVTTRRAGADDIDAIVRVHALSRRHAYAAFLPAENFSDGAMAARRARHFAALADPGPLSAMVLAEAAGEVIAFGACAAQSGDHHRHGGEITQLYVLPSHFGQGIGRMLLGVLAHHLLDGGIGAATVCAYRDNAPAVAFYRRVGARHLADHEADKTGARVMISTFAFDDLTALTDFG